MSAFGQWRTCTPSLHRGLEMVPLLLLLGHEISESRVAPKAIEIGVLFEERVARKAVVRGLAQVLKCQPRLVHPRVRRCDDVLGVMKLRITFFFPECLLDPLLSPARIFLGGRKQCLQTGEESTSVL